jgi:serine/threonine protein kinase
MQVLHSSRLNVYDYREFVEGGRFNKLEPMGSGGQAVVELSSRPGVVIKRTRRLQDGNGKQISHFDKDLARLTLELRILTSTPFRQLDLFVKVVGVCFEEPFAGLDPSGAGQFHLLLEYSELGDMASFLRRNGQQLDTKLKIDLAFQVSRGLVVLHNDYICHGDLKTQNILIFNGNDGRHVAKLADFGLSVHTHYGDVLTGSKRDVYYPLGTPLLNAPEVRNQAPGAGSVDIAAAIKADIFSFGLLLWEILNNGHSFFDVAWLDPFRRSTQELDVEEKMAFLSALPCNGLLTYGEKFLSAQNMDEIFYEKGLQAFNASLQDDPLQRQPIQEIWKILLPEAEKTRFD